MRAQLISVIKETFFKQFIKKITRQTKLIFFMEYMRKLIIILLLADMNRFEILTNKTFLYNTHTRIYFQIIE